VSDRSRLRRLAGGPWRWLQTTACRLVFDRHLLDTSDRVYLEDLGLAAPGRVEYAASGWLFARRMLRGCHIEPDDVFVDFGSGKGRMVYIAARHYGFARVVGVEIAPQLVDIARENIERARSRLRCQNVELVTADAAKWPIPDDMTYAYFYNPFVGDVFRRVLENVGRSLDRAPRPVTLVYANPVLEDEVLATGRFQLMRESTGLRRDIPLYRIAVFASTG
jgi:hypothetical protein